VAKATTVRFTEEMFARLDQASSQTGMPINSIVIAACLEWMSRHLDRPLPVAGVPPLATFGVQPAPRWATLRRAVELAAGKRGPSPVYPFERFTATAQKMLTDAQAEAQKIGHAYIGTEHLLLAAFAEPGSHAASVLATLGVREGAVRAMIDKVLRGEKKHEPRDHIVPTSRVKKVIELAFKLCSAAGQPRVSTGHILLALSIEGQGIAAHALNDLGAQKEQIESALDQLLEPEA
jgi:hypothetical protein